MIVKCDWEPDSMFFLDAEIHDKKKKVMFCYIKMQYLFV